MNDRLLQKALQECISTDNYPGIFAVGIRMTFEPSTHGKKTPILYVERNRWRSTTTRIEQENLLRNLFEEQKLNTP